MSAHLSREVSLALLSMGRGGGDIRVAAAPGPSVEPSSERVPGGAAAVHAGPEEGAGRLTWLSWKGSQQSMYRLFSRSVCSRTARVIGRTSGPRSTAPQLRDDAGFENNTRGEEEEERGGEGGGGKERRGEEERGWRGGKGGRGGPHNQARFVLQRLLCGVHPSWKPAGYLWSRQPHQERIGRSEQSREGAKEGGREGAKEGGNSSSTGRRLHTCSGEPAVSCGSSLSSTKRSGSA